MNPSRLFPLCFVLLATIASAAEPLPRVLILGDNFYNDPSRTMKTQLKGRVEVVWKYPGDSSSALANIDEILGSDKWDVIHFNFGLSDLHYKDPSTKAIRAMTKRSGGVRVTTPEQYEKNLQLLVKRLKATGAKLVWATTTPIRHSPQNLHDLGSELEYNTIAAKIMAEHQVVINDMHTFVSQQIESKKPIGNEPYQFEKIQTLTPMLSITLKQLGMPVKE